MPHQIYLPPKVIESISKHVRAGVKKAVAGFYSGAEDEDTMTGDLFSCLRCSERTVHVAKDNRSELSGNWTWSIGYTKFRGRGIHSTESLLGADGIIQLRLVRGTRSESKALLFQSKIVLEHDPAIVKQALLLSTWREASMILNYTPETFETISIDEILRARGQRDNVKHVVPLEEALCNHFLICKIGSTSLRYDNRQRRLIWRATNGQLVSAKFSVPRRLQIEVKSPVYGDDYAYDVNIPKEKVSEYRLEVSQQDVMSSFLNQESPISITPAKRFKDLSLAYHPDKYGDLDAISQAIATRRMQEVNEARVTR